MVVFDNKWQFRNLKLLSDAARIDGSGMYFSDQNRIDFKAQVSPLVGLDAIVSGIFGNLITKDGKILTTTFRIRGLYSSPDIRLEPFDNVKNRKLISEQIFLKELFHLSEIFSMNLTRSMFQNSKLCFWFHSPYFYRTDIQEILRAIPALFGRVRYFGDYTRRGY